MFVLGSHITTKALQPREEMKPSATAGGRLQISNQTRLKRGMEPSELHHRRDYNHNLEPLQKRPRRARRLVSVQNVRFGRLELTMWIDELLH